MSSERNLNRRLIILGRKWFDCAECHQETADHPLLQSFEMTFACKKCKKCFRKDAREFEERYGLYSDMCSLRILTGHSDEYCPHCDNHFVLDAVTPKPSLQVEGEDVRVDARHDITSRLKVAPC